MREKAGDRGDVGQDRVAREGERVERALGGGVVPGSAGVGDHDRDEAQVGAVANGGLDPDLDRDADDREGAICASRSANSSGVPSKADIESLSKTASDARGRSSGTIWNPGESRRNGETTSSTRSLRCQAIAVRSWETPISSVGRVMCR